MKFLLVIIKSDSAKAYNKTTQDLSLVRVSPMFLRSLNPQNYARSL